MQLSLPLRRASASRRALDLALGFALGAAFAYVLERVMAERRARAVEEPADDPLLLGRVRLALAQTIADPDAVDLRVQDGIVLLRGPASADQIAEMVACAARVRGVRAVDNRLSPIG